MADEPTILTILEGSACNIHSNPCFSHLNYVRMLNITLFIKTKTELCRPVVL